MSPVWSFGKSLHLMALGYEQGDGLHFAEKEAESQELLMASHGALSVILRHYPKTTLVLLPDC